MVSFSSFLNSSTLQVFSLEQLKTMEPAQVAMKFYPSENFQRKTIPLTDFQTYYDHIHAKGSKVNVAFYWLQYKEDNPTGYKQSQFHELYNRIVE